MSAPLRSLRRLAARPAPATYLAEIIPPRSGRLDALALENLFQALCLNASEPVALELYGAAEERRLLVRATSARSLAHLCAQVRAHTPQAEARPLVLEPELAASGSPVALLAAQRSTLGADPLRLDPSVCVRARVLRLRAAAHLPLKLYTERELGEEGVDPLLGVLAAMDGLPPDGQVLAQLALAPASERWSRRLQRLAVEHPLAQERAQEALRARAGSGGAASSSAGGGPPLLPLLALLSLLVGYRMLGPSILTWWRARDLLHLAQLGLGCLTLLLALVALLVVRARLTHHAVYDMRLVEGRTARLAARVRLTLVASAPQPPLSSSDTPPAVTPAVETAATVAVAAPRDAFWARRSLSNANVTAQERATSPAPPVARTRATPPAAAAWALGALDTVLDALVAAYRQHALASGNGFVAQRLSSRAARRLVTQWPRQARRSPDLLNVRELAALWHLPAGDAEVPLVERTRAKALLAPAAPLARGHRVGVSAHAGHVVPVHLPPEALRHNALLVAKTGKGKSSLLQSLACAALTQEAPLTSSPTGAIRRVGTGGQDGGMVPYAGVVVVDPHGDLVTSLLGLIPPRRRSEVVLVDLGDTAYPVALNPLDALLGRDRDKAVESLLGILSQIWARFWGPRMQNALDSALKTLYEANEALVRADPQHGPDQQFTLLDVAPVLSAPGFRRDVLSLVQDQALHTWWTHYYKPLDPRLQLEIINPVLTKLAAFSGSRVARRIVGQGRSTLDLGEIVREGKILLVNTAKGVVGSETATLVGATLLGALQVSLEEQARLAPEKRNRFLVLVDEFQSILGVDYAAMLSELRKFGGSFALATQALAHLDALDPTLRPTVLANVDALYAFAVSADDARALARELDEAVEVSDLSNLDDFTCYAKLTLDGRRLPVFSLALDPPPPGDDAVAQQIRTRARTRYARPVEAVEEALARAAARYLPPHEVHRPASEAQDSPPPTSVETPSDLPQHAPEHPATGGDQRKRDRRETASLADNEITNAASNRNRRGRFGRRKASERDAESSLVEAADLWSDLGVLPQTPLPSSAGAPFLSEPPAPVEGERLDADEVKERSR